MLLIAAGLAVLAVLYVALPIGASQLFNPTLEITAISDPAPSANADITIRTSLLAGEHNLGHWSLDIPSDWDIAGDKKVPDGHITAVGTMAVDEGCNSSIETYGPFTLRDQSVPGGPSAPEAEWVGTITDFMDADPNTFWDLNLTVDGSAVTGFAIGGFMTDFFGVSICTPQTFTITVCGRANPSSTATVCGSGADPVVMTNPVTPATYTWSGQFESDGGGHPWSDTASICIGTSCPTPTPTATPTPMDTDGDGFTDDAEVLFIGTDPLDGCADDLTDDANPADLDNNGFFASADLSLIAGVIGQAVPPATSRRDIAPETPDGIITSADLSEVAARIGQSCAP